MSYMPAPENEFNLILKQPQSPDSPSDSGAIDTTYLQCPSVES